MKRHSISYACLTAGLLSAVILPGSAWAEDKGTPPPPPPGKGERGPRPEMTPEQREEMKQKRLDHLAEKLGLDDSQKEKVKAIMEEQGEKMKALHEDESIEKGDKREKMMEIMKEGRDQIAAILTDEQKAKFAEMKERGPGGPGGPGGRHGGKDGEGKPGGGKVPEPSKPTT